MVIRVAIAKILSWVPQNNFYQIDKSINIKTKKILVEHKLTQFMLVKKTKRKITFNA